MADKPVPVISTNLMTPPPVFNGEPKHFPVWQEHFKAFLHLSKVNEDEDKRAMLVCSLSTVVQQTLLALIAPNAIKDLKYDDLLAKLEVHYKVTPIMLAEYYRFFTASRPSGMTYSEYAIHLRSLAAECAWPIKLDRALAVGFVMGIEDNVLRQQLLQRDHASLDNALAQAKQFESIVRESTRGGSRPTNSAELVLVNQTGHLARVCRSKPNASQNESHGGEDCSQKKRREESNKVNQMFFDIDSISVASDRDSSRDSQSYEVALQVNGRPARLQFDTGAAVTLINEALWRDLGRPGLEESAVVCRSVTGQQIPVMGQAVVDVIYNGQSAHLKMLVTSQSDNVMGRSWIRALQITDLNALHSSESSPVNVCHILASQRPASLSPPAVDDTPEPQVVGDTSPESASGQFRLVPPVERFEHRQRRLCYDASEHHMETDRVKGKLQVDSAQPPSGSPEPASRLQGMAPSAQPQAPSSSPLLALRSSTREHRPRAQSPLRE
uniref:Peptidase A2 domain-containing protein n=1 Tax=Plectus sambesii TaxID=2011161 RepID=A0A914VEE4_9BILA